MHGAPPFLSPKFIYKCIEELSFEVTIRYNTHENHRIFSHSSFDTTTPPPLCTPPMMHRLPLIVEHHVNDPAVAPHDKATNFPLLHTLLCFVALLRCCHSPALFVLRQTPPTSPDARRTTGTSCPVSLPELRAPLSSVPPCSKLAEI